MACILIGVHLIGVYPYRRASRGCASSWSVHLHRRVSHRRASSWACILQSVHLGGVYSQAYISPVLHLIDVYILVGVENGRRWRMAVAGEWQALETGSRWRMGVAGEWEALETGRRLEIGRRWRMRDAGDR